MAQLALRGKAKETPAQAATDEPIVSRADETAGDERLALKRELLMVQDHLADIEARLARLRPFVQAGSLLRSSFRLILSLFQTGAQFRRLDPALAHDAPLHQ